MRISTLKWSLLFIAAIAMLPAPGRSVSSADDDLISRSRAMYAALNSYSDTGAVISEYGSASNPSKDQHTFTTYFRRSPRGFYFEFKKQSGDRFVIWGDPEAFHTWWKTTGVKTDYPNPNNVGAFIGSEVTTKGASSKIPSLLYKKGALPSDFINFTDGVVEGKEDLGGHQCYRLTGTAKDVYGATGREVNIRKMTVWIDSESLLIRKTVEEWKPLPGQVSRTTTTFEPQANPTIDDSKLKFTPPQ